MMVITVNGKTREAPEAVDLAGFIQSLGLRTENVIAELNQAVVPRIAWQATILRSGDCLELAALVGGG